MPAIKTAPKVIEDLTEEEAYLWAILSDPSGLDQAEFLWVDEEKEHDLPNEEGVVGAEDSPGSFVFRAWPFQWSWYRCKDQQQVDQMARSVGKSQSIQLRACAFPLLHPGQEMVICAPELNHLEPITDLVETRLNSTRLYQALLKGGRSGITHRPLKINFKNGARIMGRIPQKTGAGMKGIHPIWLEMDEAQDFPKPGWTEIYETLKRGNPNSIWRVHGVTRGVHDNFWKITQPGEGWTVHRAVAMNRPHPYWSDEEREAKILLYHGEENGDYKRNVLGEHGDENSPIFSLHRLMACVDDEPGSAYNEDEYCHYEIYDSWLRQTGRSILEEIDLPYSHTEKYKKFWVGMDVGWVNHPSEILVYAEETLTKDEYKFQKSHLSVGRRKAVPPTQDMPRLKLVCRITLWQIATPDQEATIMKIIQHYKPVAFSCDATGGGWPMFQNIQRQMERPELSFIKTIIKGYNFSGNILIDLDKTITVSEWATKDEIIKETGIKRNTVDHATDILRILIDSGRMWLPWEKDLLDEFQGQTYKVKADINQIGRREYSLGSFHALDAARMAVLGWQQYGIEEFVKNEDQKPVYDVFVGS